MRLILLVALAISSTGGIAGAGALFDRTSSSENAPAIDCGSVDSAWTNVNQWEEEILAAQQQVEAELGVLVPTNVIKAIIRIETGGVMPAGPDFMGAAGLMNLTPMTIGAAHYDFARMATDPAYSIYAGTYELALRYLDSGKLPWENVAVGYFAGHYYPTGASDAYTSDRDYQGLFLQSVAELEACVSDLVPSPVPAGSPEGAASGWLAGVGSGLDGLAYLWGNEPIDGHPAPLVQEFGPTDFSVNVHPEWYTYSLDYGFDQPGHTGLDIGLPVGTPLYAPTDAVVVCAGTDNGNGEDSCAAFTHSYGGWTSGRLQLKLPNGDMLIFGHVSASLVEPGERVARGQQVGLSGSQDGARLHLEYRTPDPSTPSGWRIVDPRLTSLNGASATSTTAN
jgi:murein DD-endopeptidase MepM/ murein hydrolase activator NlpD